MKKHDDLSPFELKDQLIKLARSHSDRMMLNAGRGNPNFLATAPRYAFLRLGEFALQEAERSYNYVQCHLGGMPEKKGIVSRYDTFAAMQKSRRGIDFISATLSFADDHLDISKADLLHEMVMAYLGCNYPTPPRMLSQCEQLVKLYLSHELCGTVTQSDEFDIFATEGGTAGMTYLFNSLLHNGLLQPGDHIAMITPIFSPYLEIPNIPEYHLNTVDIQAEEEQGWQVPDSELAKLHDPKIKLLFMVNPSNPPSVKMNNDFLKKIAKIVNEQRRDLMIVTDDVYATFANNYRSLFATCPFNTVCVYSFSKYFGATGWRLGTLSLHQNNIFDERISQLSEAEHQRLDKRYASLTQEPRQLKFIDRLVADSRCVALNHTAGLSLPQQLQMLLLALASLLDEGETYKMQMQRLIRRRYDILYCAIGVYPQTDENAVDYYTVIDLEQLATHIYDSHFAAYLIKKTSRNEFIMRLADETGVVLLPGKGFAINHPSVRVSLANLSEANYRAIGAAVKKILQEFYQSYSS